MENSKVVSFRLEPKVIKMLDNFTIKHRYWKRNAIVNQLLVNVLSKLSDKDIYDIVRTNRLSTDDFNSLHISVSKD